MAKSRAISGTVLFAHEPGLDSARADDPLDGGGPGWNGRARQCDGHEGNVDGFSR